MGRQIIELVQVLVDRIYQDGYQQRCREDDIADVYKRLNEAEGQAKHWKQARQNAMAAGELMRAEIVTLRQQLADAQREASEEHAENEQDVGALQQQIIAGDATMKAQCAEIEHLRAFVATIDAMMATPFDGCEFDTITEAQAKLASSITNPVSCAVCESLQNRLGVAITENGQLAGQLIESRQWASHCERAKKDASTLQDAAHAEIETLRQQLADAKQETADLREQLDAAQAAVTLQRAGIERLQAFVGKVRKVYSSAHPHNWMSLLRPALDELDAETEPTPVADALDAEGGQ